MLMSNGCASTEERLVKAVEMQAKADAGIALPDLPAECRKHIGRVIPKSGEKVRWTQKRWEYSADVADRQIDDCAAFYDDTKNRFEKGR
jgi:co-chaperonin GroES (HSP10)